MESLDEWEDFLLTRYPDGEKAPASRDCEAEARPDVDSPKLYYIELLQKFFPEPRRW
jgi:hypothetical protein